MTDKSRWSSICRGATLWGLEHTDPAFSSSVISSPTVTSRLSRYSYGMAFSELYDPSKHVMEDVYVDQEEGHYRAKDQMTWLLKRVRENKPTTLPPLTDHKPGRRG